MKRRICFQFCSLKAPPLAVWTCLSECMEHHVMATTAQLVVCITWFHIQSCWCNDSDSCSWRPGFCLLSCAVCHLHMCISLPPRKQSAASCSCLRLCCYSSTDASRSAHQLTEDRCNPEQDNTKRSQTAPGNVHRKEWVQVEVFLWDNSACKSVFLVNVRNQEI